MTSLGSEYHAKSIPSTTYSHNPQEHSPDGSVHHSEVLSSQVNSQLTPTILPIHSKSMGHSTLSATEEMGHSRSLSSVDKIEEKQQNTRSARMSQFANAMPSNSAAMPLTERVKLWSSNDTIMLIFYTFLSILTRLYRIGSNHKVVWDEAHFGKFGSYYIRHLFYFDVHPPLGKILVAVAGWLSGFDGNYEFESGSDYPDNVPFVRMRIIMALYGIAMVPVAYMTAQSLGWNWRSKHLFTLMVLLGAYIRLTQTMAGLQSHVSYYSIPCYLFSRSVLFRPGSLPCLPWTSFYEGVVVLAFLHWCLYWMRD